MGPQFIGSSPGSQFPSLSSSSSSASTTSSSSMLSLLPSSFSASTSTSTTSTTSSLSSSSSNFPPSLLAAHLANLVLNFQVLFPQTSHLATQISAFNILKSLILQQYEISDLSTL